MTTPAWEAYAPAAVRRCAAAAQQILDRCAQLAGISSMADGICRSYLSDEHRRANALTADWLAAAGCKVWQDPVGNICGRYPAATAGAPTLLLGSHLDTIPNAGAYDGILGVLLAIAAVAERHAHGERLPFNVDVIGFGEEEGVRFGTTLMTSRACAGAWDDAWWALQDADGISLREAFERFGLDPERVHEATRPDLLRFFEVHIEQGPVLESLGLPLGTVTRIAGNRRLRARIDGHAGHAGTTPMPLRRDAGVAAALAGAELERIALRDDVMATVGQLQFEPGGVNVIPGGAAFTVDIRAPDDARRDAALARYRAFCETLCAERGLRFTLEEFHQAPAMHCSELFTSACDRALAMLDHPPQCLSSGAGHDATAMAAACPAGMLFLRCTGGISHHPDEAVTLTDVAWSLAALQRVLDNLAIEFRS